MHAGPVLTLAEAAAARVVVLDGGLATELERRGHRLTTALWSAELLVADPAAIVAVHRAYLAAGAEVVTTASYQASVAGFAAVGADPERMLRRSVTLAVRAREEHGSGWVAASVGPYGAVLADGSEYRGRYGLTVTELRRFHRPRLEILADAAPDVLAVETVPCLAEAEALISELQRLQFPAWISFTASGGRTRAGEPLAEAFALASSCPSVFAVGINCTAPSDVLPALEIARAASDVPLVVYPNSGEGWDPDGRHWTGSSGFRPAEVDSWVATGARLVGGCCRVGPAEIAAVAGRVRSRTHGDAR
jgi:homocysteine S-methyltransferase